MNPNYGCIDKVVTINDSVHILSYYSSAVTFLSVFKRPFCQYCQYKSAKLTYFIRPLSEKNLYCSFGTAFVLSEASADEADRDKLNNNK